MKVKFITLGCKTNQYETNAMEQNFKENGYEIINSDENNNADIYVVNTCSVTNIAERKSRQMLRRVKQENKNAIIAACGCYAQVAKEEIEKMPEVDIIIGINEKNKIADIIEEYLKKEKNKEVEVSDVMNEKEFQDFGSITYTELTRAIVKIQDGCDRFCTYCIIPYARGRVRSRSPKSIIDEIRKVSKISPIMENKENKCYNEKDGFKEVVITGIHIASYGKDFTKEQAENYRKMFGYDNNYKKYDPKYDLSTGGFRLIELLEQINKIDGIERIRLGSIEPKLITEEFVERLSKLNKVCNHFHLSLQSGCDSTLKRMNRRYTTEEFEKSAEMLRKNFKDVHLTTDIIVGFPGETEEEFNKTYEFLKNIKFYKMHIFKYSIRKNTVAEKMPNQVDGLIKEKRSKILIDLSNKNQEEYNKEMLGKNVKVLFEEEKEENGVKYYKGHTTNYAIVKVKSSENICNKIIDVRITDLDNNDFSLIGEIN